MRALFFLNSFAGGGAEKVCLNLAKQFHRQNIASDFITLYNEKPDYEIPDYIQMYCLDIEDKPLECINIALAVSGVNRFISDKEYTLITAHLQPAQFLASLTVVRRKCLYVIHHRVDVNQSWINKFVFERFVYGKKIVAVSKGVAKELQQKYGVKAGNIEVIYNPCGVSALKSKYGADFPHTRPYILVMGRLIEGKDPLQALELFYRGRFFEQYDLIYLGKGPYEEIIRNQIDRYDIKDYVFLAGFQKSPERWLANASLLLSCSRQEGFSMVLAEALICGVPVVSTDCPYGPNEILIDELSEYLIYPECDFDKSISTIASALKAYPEITEKYFIKFDDKSIAQTYINVWNRFFVTQ